MTPSSPSYLNSTETMAERAWRYGETGASGQFVFGPYYDRWEYPDGSALVTWLGLPAYVLVRPRNFQMEIRGRARRVDEEPLEFTRNSTSKRRKS